MEGNDLMFKVLVVGNAGVGKTSILKQLIYKTYSPQYKSTVGVDFGFYKVQLSPQRYAKMMMYDIAGQERYNVLIRSYYKDAYAAFVVADLQSVSLKDDIQLWKQSLDEKVIMPSTTDSIPCFLLLNKCDLPHQYKDEEIQKISEDLGFKRWFKTSALTGENLEKASLELGKYVVNIIDELKIQKSQGVIVQETDQEIIQIKNTQQKKCC